MAVTPLRPHAGLRASRRAARKTATMAFAGLLLAGCALPPNRIVPLAVSARDFDPMTCEALSVRIEQNAAARLEAERQQRNLAYADAATVLVTLVPVSLLVGDRSVDVAVTKGNDTALRRAHAQKDCPEP